MMRIRNRIFLAAVSCLIFAALLCGCADGSYTQDGASEESGEERLSVVTTIFPAYDFARQVFGDTADVTLLLKPGTEAHSYDPTARDIVKIESCDLFIYNGGESDEWVESILDAAASSTDGISTLKMMDSVQAIEEEYSEGMQEADGTEESDHDHDEDETEYDEHIWTSPVNAVLIVESICDKAAELAPEYAEEYRTAAQEYIDALTELDSNFRTLLDGEERYFVFGDRFPLLYFFREYGLNYYAAFPGCGSETEPSAQTVTFLLDKLESEDTIKTVFYIELSNHKLADILAADTGLTAQEFHTCHNITADDFEAGETYLSLMQRNYDMLCDIVVSE